MLYLANPPSPDRLVQYQAAGLGVMLTPNMGNRYQDAWPCYAIDNGRFTRPDLYDDDRYLGYLDGKPRSALFATAPDVVGDWDGTLEMSLPMLSLIRKTGHRAAVCLQEGVTVDGIPWSEIDAVFIGGGDAFKTATITQDIVDHANSIGLWTHMGRVNTRRRIRQAKAMGCKSVDGTTIGFEPDVKLPFVVRSLEAGGYLQGELHDQ